MTRFGDSKIFLCVVLGFTVIPAAQTQAVRATLSDMSIRQCHGHKRQYQLFLSARFVIENTSDTPLFISNRIALTPELRAATSEQQVRKGVFFLDRQDVYGGDSPNLTVPDLTAFRRLKPGEKVSFLFDPLDLTVRTNWYKCAESKGKTNCVIEHSKNGKARRADLEAGKVYWLQIGFYTFPEYFYWNREEFLRFKKAWSSVAQVPEDLIWTEPFRFVVESRDPQAPTCE